MTGKGDTPRPMFVDPDTYAANWTKAFGGAIDDPSGYDARDHFHPPLRPIRGEWPIRDRLPTTDPEAAE